MSRSEYSPKHRRKKILALAKGFVGRSKNCYKIAVERVEKGWQYAYRDRRNKKREFRALWIQRINAAVRARGISYSRFIDMLHKNSCLIDRKMLAHIAVNHPGEFDVLFDKIIASILPQSPSVLTTSNTASVTAI